MLTLTYNYSDRHATINCNFKSLKILQIKITSEKNGEKKHKLKWLYFMCVYMVVYNKWQQTSLKFNTQTDTVVEQGKMDA